LFVRGTDGASNIVPLWQFLDASPFKLVQNATPKALGFQDASERGDLVVDGARCETFGNSLTSQPQDIIGRNIADQALPELDGKRRHMVLKSFKALWRQGIL
jgi:hypothetical protein